MTINPPAVFYGKELDFTHPAQIKKICGISLTTARRWRKHRTFPAWAIKLLCLESGYFTRPGWHGWQIAADGKLYSPALTDGFSPGDIESICYLRQRCAQLERLNQAPAQYLFDMD